MVAIHMRIRDDPRHGGPAVSPEDIRRVALPVLRHRILPNFTAEAEGITAERIIEEVLKAVMPPRGEIRL